MGSKQVGYKKSPLLSWLVGDYSPMRVLITLAILIFFAEIAAMIILFYLQIGNYLVATVVDGVIMVLLIMPCLHFLQLRPILIQIDERKRVEQALRSSEGLLSKVLKFMPVGVWLTDKSGKIILGNLAGEQLWGGAKYVGMEQYDEYKGWWTDTGERVKPEEWGGTRAVTEGVTCLDEEIEIEGFDGSHKFILNSAVPILDEQNRIQGAIVINQDISRQKETEKALIRTNDLLERFFQSIHTLIAYLDRDLNFIRVNEAYARSAGHPAEFFIGKNHFALYPNEENEAIFRKVVDTGEPYTVFEKPFEYDEYPERGVTYWDWNVLPVRGANQIVEGLVFSLIEVTERKRAEIKLQQQNLELRELSNSEHQHRIKAEVLAQAIVTINSSLDPEQVLCSILEQIRNILPFKGGSIFLIEDDTLQVSARLGFEDFPESIPDMGIRYPLEDFPLVEQICKTLKPISINTRDERAGWNELPGLEWICSILAVPLILGNEALGVIYLVSDLPSAFPQEAVVPLQDLAAPATLALRNARLYHAEQKARKVAETLGAAALDFTQTLDLELVISNLLEHIGAIIHSDTTGIALMEGQTRLATRAVRGHERWADPDRWLSIVVDVDSNPLMKRLVSDRQSILIPDTKKEPAWKAFPGPELIRSWLGVPLIAGDKVVGLVGMGKTEKDYFTEDHIQWAEALVGQATIAIQNAWLFEQVRASSDRLQGLSRRLVEVQENERRYIASELHDEVGQALTTLMVQLQLIEGRAEQPEAVRAEVASMGRILDSVIENLHRLAMDLRPASLDYLGLEVALQQHVGMMREKLGLEIQFAMTGINERLPANIEITFYRIVQEGINNVARHARAKHVDVLITQRDECLVLIIEDDGVGFNPEEVKHTKRIGLSGMRERAEALGGKLVVESVPAHGTTLLVEVPYANPNFDR